MALRQAEAAAAAGRFDEALALMARPDVADHHHAVKLRARLAVDLIGRAGRRAAADDVAGALDDLDLAERSGAPPDALAAARLKVAEQVADEVRSALDAGEPARVVERVETLAKRKVGGPALRRAKETAEAWQAALDEARRGEFGRAFDQLDRADRLAAGAAQVAAQAALAVSRRDVETRQKTVAPKVEALYAALAAGRASEVLSAADAVLETVPEHPAARQARVNAWRQVAALPAAATLPSRGARVPQPAAPPPSAPAATEGIVWLNAVTRNPANHAPPLVRAAAAPRPSGSAPGPSGRFLLWMDAVGGYLVCLDDRIVLGRAGPDSQADVALLGDLARAHATIIRDGEGYVIKALGPTFVNGRAIESAPLRDGDVVRLGPAVELEFRQPSPVSATARLTVVSRHRLPVAVDGVLLMAETCIIGPSSQAHVPARSLAEPVVLYRQGSALWCRASAGFEADGKPRAVRAPLTLRSSVLGDGFSFSLEALGTKTV